MVKCTKPSHKANKPPLWSAIAKQNKPTIICHEEKLPEENNNRNRFSNNYWNTRNNTNRNNNNNMNNYNGSISSTSTTSNKSENNNAITPSPSPPTYNNRINRRNSNNSSSGSSGSDSNTKERCRVFVSNLPPNVTHSDIRNAFSHCGEIANTVWFPSRTDGKFYGSGPITFCDGDGSREALIWHIIINTRRTNEETIVVILF